MTVLVTGGRGSVARGVVAGLLAAGVPVRLSGREPEALSPPEGVETALVDLARPETLPPALAGVDRVFLYAEPSGVDAFIAAATDAGVEQVVVLSSSSVLESGPNRIGDNHRAVEDAVRAAGFASTMLRPGGFDGNARQWLPAILGDGVVRLPYPESGDASIDERDIADTAVVVLLAGPGGPHDGTAPQLTGPASLTRREQVEQLAAALGREVRIEPVAPDDTRAFLAASMPEFVVDSLLPHWAAADGVPAAVTESVETITGRPARTFATWAREVATPLAVR
jgi:uncharacterized protein YbjT (DUF2867 family)